MRPAGIFLRGLAMGAADIVPGVSGGTTAVDDRRIPPVVARHSFLLIGAVMFLINHHQTHSFQGCENCRTRSYHHIDFTPAHPHPLIPTLSTTETAMEDSNPRLEALSEKSLHLSCESNLRHQH